MTDRLIDFKAVLPQLEEEPGRFRGGVKRFRLHKNEGSPAFILGGSNSEVSNSYRVSSPTITTPIPSSVKSKDYSRNSLILEATKKMRSPVKVALNDPLHNEMLSLLSHPAFQQPVYTKLRPKVINNNPITGVSSKQSFSPEPFRRLVHTGARVMSLDKYSFKH
jgi:hypothetical protein